MANLKPSAANAGKFTAGLNGTVWRFPLGTVVPSDPTTPLGEIAEGDNIGYINEAGVTFAANREEGDELKAFGGDVIDASAGTYSPSAQFGILETKRLAALKLVYANADVKEAAGKITVTDTGAAPESAVLAFEFLRKGWVLRIIIDEAVFATVGDRTINSEDLDNIDVTYKARRATNGSFKREGWAEVIGD